VSTTANDGQQSSTEISSELAPADVMMSSFTDNVNTATRCSLTDEDEPWPADVAGVAELRRLRVTAVAVALVPLSCLCVVAGIWSASVASTVLTRSSTETNSSTLSVTLCCTNRYPSTPPDNCWIASDLDAADARCAEARLDADKQLTEEIWRNVSAYFGCAEILSSHVISRVNVKLCNSSANASYCVDVCCNAPGNGSSSSGLALTGRTIISSSATAWIVSGLTALAAVAVVGLACLVTAAGRYHSGRLRTAVSETREALARRRSAVVDQCRCERLLTDMLPSGVAERLKMGQTVEPETFDVVSIYFSDIVGFNDVALSCESPLVIVRLLNSVFRYISFRYFYRAAWNVDAVYGDENSVYLSVCQTRGL